VKKFTIVLFSIIFVTLISSSVQSVVADHLEPGIGIFKDADHVNFTKTTDSNSKYQLYVQVQVRNEENQLISITETDRGNYIPHEIGDLAFYEMLGKIEIITIDNVKYEKIHSVITPDAYTTATPKLLAGEPDFIGKWSIQLCGEIDGHGHKCVPVFQSFTTPVHVIETDVITVQWTILRVID
jgi:hypothetical protein